MEAEAQRAIAQAAGDANFFMDHAQRLLYASDATGWLHPPEAVVRATDEAQISRVLRACSDHRVPVAPRGAGTGLTGGSLPVAGGVALDMAGLDRIVRVSAADQTAVVEPGVVTGRLQAAARAQGLFYPPDPASAEFCTIGGNVAENAGGLRAVKYGVTRDYVLALRAVLPDGRVFASGRSTIKSVVGYDLTRLIVGSEGTLAVITQLTLRLLPQPESVATLSALYMDVDEAAGAVSQILLSGVRPVACEFMDAHSIKVVEAHAGLGLDPEAQALLLIELDGPPEVVDRQARQVEELLAGAGGRDVRRAQDEAQREQLWKARRAVSPALYKLAPNKLNEDVSLPLGALPAMVRRLHQVSERRGVAIATFGHAGDGNLHVNIMYDGADQAQAEAAEQAVTDLFAHTLELGGSLSGEHGVGTAKLGYVGAEIDPVALELMRGLKRLFDPAGILNPRKAIPGPGELP